MEEHDHEGRVITAEFPEYYVITCYTPNSQNELARLDYRMEWEDAWRAYLKGLDEKKPVIFCGDFNVAHQEIDLKNPKTNRSNAGFTDQERNKFTELLKSGLRIPGAIFIRSRRASIPGGPIDSRPGRRMPGGVLTIFVYQTA